MKQNKRINHKTKIIIFNGFWTVDDVKKNPHALFVYGDNDVHVGKGGQAIIRDCVNTIGLPTKKYPNNQLTSFYTDLEYHDNIKKIDYAINNIINLSKKYDYVVLPRDGFGTGLAKLKENAPETLNHINQRIEFLKKVI
ncbi:hypothetical protein CE11_00477 [Megavirus courdo11]|uniref:DUF7831 domain-containing protein n=5 Tax=Megamimivirinae TaxID=3044648 RepID=A0A2L2DM90_MIMIV|nr:hypothetical protein MegaChil _gp0452 [Megavirus chiliensis]AEX61587.1 hypothetical protein c7_L524 [Megavirus courdo7]AFX92504.1 hypothetical protein CE11_00477 [Megavirus courdo11]AUV58399.1 hypothetical protein [Bandra megavirus]AVG47288.1 hypothetical protein [Acanthamoeba polyphaga mimivirus]AVL93781.1 hypothetical protein mvi_421 [Megavirus vitis]